MNNFGQLFKKYRLRSEFETIAAFSKAFAENGYFYDDSIFSHWQKGKRIPTNRALLVSLIELFIKREAMHSVREANEFLESAGHGYLTDSEQLYLQTCVRQLGENKADNFRIDTTSIYYPVPEADAKGDQTVEQNC